MSVLNDIEDTLEKLKAAKAECIADAEKFENESLAAQEKSENSLKKSSEDDELIVLLEGLVAGVNEKAKEKAKENETFLRELYNADDVQRQSIIERRGGELNIDFESTAEEEMAEEDS